jgi:uncharacterized protein (TIGR02145 family)
MSKTVSRFAFAAGVVLAMAFTFSCSPPDDDGGNPSSSSGGGGGYTGSYGSITYEGQTYKTVKIGEQTWMAENLNYEAEGSKCYDNNTANCTKYGRLYNWETAMTACPSGWHLPSNAEWTILTDYVGSDAGTKLKSTSGWPSIGNGTDNYGFSALPGGFGNSSGGFSTVGDYGYWWSTTETNSINAYCRYMFYVYSDVIRDFNSKSNLYSVRCLQD